METSALNAAHAKERRAEALVRERKFEEAAKCHEQAAHLFSQIQIRVNVSPDLDDIRCTTVDNFIKNLDPLTRSSQFNIALESIQLQRDYHHKQAAFVRMKQAQYEEYKATMEVQEKELQFKQSVNKNSGKGSTGNFVTIDRGEKFLHQAIDRAMEEQDSLLELILPPRNGNVVLKRPKDPAVVLEELRTVNGQLRLLIGTLLGQLEASQHQVKILTEQLRAATASDKEPLTLTNDDSSMSLSPLPPLAPLEMPPFDFSTR